MRIRKPLVLDWLKTFYQFATSPKSHKNGTLNYGDLYARIFIVVMVFILVALFVFAVLSGGFLAFLPLLLVFGLPYIITEAVHQFRG